MIELKNCKQLLVDYKAKLQSYKYDNQSILNQYYDLFENEWFLYFPENNKRVILLIKSLNESINMK